MIKTVKPTSKANLKRAANLMKALSHPARLQILFFVEDKEERVFAIQKHVRLTQAMTSQHLKVLLDSGYLDRRREGTSIHYKLSKKQGKKILPYLEGCAALWDGPAIGKGSS